MEKVNEYFKNLFDTKKKMLILFFTLFLLCLILIIMLYNHQHKRLPVTQLSDEDALFEEINSFKLNYEMEQCKDITNRQEKEKCIISNTNCQNSYCFYLKSKHLNDISFCNMITNQKLKTTCLEEHNSVSYLEKAIENNDRAQCNMLKDEYLKENCKLNYDYVYYSKKAMSDKDIGICDKIENSHMIELCMDSFYVKQFHETEDIEFCEKIKNEDYKAQCVKIENNNISVDFSVDYKNVLPKPVTLE